MSDSSDSKPTGQLTEGVKISATAGIKCTNPSCPGQSDPRQPWRAHLVGPNCPNPFSNPLRDGNPVSASTLPSSEPTVKPREGDQPMPQASGRPQTAVTAVLLDALRLIEPQQRSPSARESIRQAISLLEAQQRKGVEKYGQSLMTWNGRDPYTDAAQEYCDMSQYITQGRLERADLLAEVAALRADLMEKDDIITNLRTLAVPIAQTNADNLTVLQALCKAAFENSKAHGFWDDEDRKRPDGTFPMFQEPCIPEKLALMHSELSEALEEYRNGTVDKPIYFKDGKQKPEGIVVELADCVIRIFDTCGRFGWQLGRAVVEKMAYNAGRPHKHGKKI